jgi:hypothetical protein
LKAKSLVWEGDFVLPTAGAQIERTLNDEKSLPHGTLPSSLSTHHLPPGMPVANSVLAEKNPATLGSGCRLFDYPFDDRDLLFSMAMKLI